jgi:hypothetical protein
VEGCGVIARVRPETREQREHRFDREAIAAVHRRQRAKEGRGYRFELPPSPQRAKP